jgi:hypothetical protein
MTLLEFTNVFAHLAIQLRQTDADEATIRVYFVALKDLDLEFIAMAADRLAKGSVWFPKTSEWRAMAATIERERRTAQRKLLRKLPTPLCAACSDTGWVSVGPGLTPEKKTASKRAEPCDCAKLRRLELLGRRPWPALPEGKALPDGADEPVTKEESEAMLTRVDPGWRRLIRVMPKPEAQRRSRLGNVAEAASTITANLHQLRQLRAARAGVTRKTSVRPAEGRPR